MGTISSNNERFSNGKDANLLPFVKIQTDLESFSKGVPISTVQELKTGRDEKPSPQTNTKINEKRTPPVKPSNSGSVNSDGKENGSDQKLILYTFVSSILVVSFLVTLVIFFLTSFSVGAASNSSPAATPSLAGNAAATATAIKTLPIASPVSENIILPPNGGVSQGGYEPQVIGQGGTCISGTIIDVYHNIISAPMDILITPKNGGSPIKKTSSGGAFQIDGLTAGTFTVAVSVPENWKPITAPVFDVVLNGTSSNCANVREKFELPGCLLLQEVNVEKTGRVAYIPGWNVTLSKDDNPSRVVTLATDSDGYAYFPNLETGRWTIAEDAWDGWWPVSATIEVQGNTWLYSIPDPEVVLTSPRPAQPYWSVPLSNPFPDPGLVANPSMYRANFPDTTKFGVSKIDIKSAPYPQDPSICQHLPVFNKQINGSILVKKIISDKGKDNIGVGVKIYLESLSGTMKPQDSILTGVDGTACFSELEMGAYKINEEQLVGYTMVNAPDNPFNLTTRQHCDWLRILDKTASFTNKKIYGEILVKKIVIDEANKEKPGEGWDITIAGPGGSQTLTTGPDGTVCFKELELGQYNISENLKPDFVQVESPSSSTRVDNDTPCAKKDALIFKNKKIPPPTPLPFQGCIEGYVINHLEQNLKGWQVQATNTNANVIGKGDTGGNGYFKIQNLPNGTYQVQDLMPVVGPPSGFSPIADPWEAVTPKELSVTVVDQDSTKCKQVRFKNRFAYACVDVWKKDAFDGVGLPIWSISLKPAYGGVAIPQSTYGDGWVRFKVQSPGDYTVVETPEAGWHSIGNSSFNLTLEASGTCTSVTFCNLQDNMTLPATPGCVAGISGGPTLQTVIPTTPTPTPSQSQSGSCSQYYTVVSGDTFYRIANLFGKSIGDLEAANPTVNPQTIYPNTVLCIP